MTNVLLGVLVVVSVLQLFVTTFLLVDLTTKYSDEEEF